MNDEDLKLFIEELADQICIHPYYNPDHDKFVLDRLEQVRRAAFIHAIEDESPTIAQEERIFILYVRSIANARRVKKSLNK